MTDLERRLRSAEQERESALSELRATERECEELGQKLRLVTGAIRRQQLDDEQAPMRLSRSGGGR